MFLDEAKINIKAGDGGSGIISFFYTKARGKKIACGGSGGRGGNVIIKASGSVSSLYNFKKKIHFKAQNGKSGMPNNRSGKNGDDLIINVPVGTIVKSEKEKVLSDLSEEGSSAVIADGGIGGKGNASLISRKKRFPSFAEKGEKVEEAWINLELRLIADVALVGFPNAGKSTIISRISAAKPRIADYPFTTTVPNLGVVSVDDESFVVADIPGLIEGAHSGVGLGDKFLRHIMRSLMLVMVLDGQKILEDGSEIIKTFDVLREEIRLYDRGLYDRDYIVAVNKIDLISDKSIAEDIKEKLEKKSGREVFLVSAFVGTGMQDLTWTLYKRIKECREKLMEEKEKELKSRDAVKIYAVDAHKLEDEKMEVRRQGNEYVVESKKLERIVSMTDFENEEALEHLKCRLKKMGIGDKLKKMGVEEGSTVIIGNLVFELKE
jgi:GTP-binding protein